MPKLMVSNKKMAAKKKKAATTRRPTVRKNWNGPKPLRDLLVPIGDLQHDPANARKHGDRNREAIAQSVKQFGQMRPVLVRKDSMRIVAGNGTVEVLRELGWSHVAAIVADISDEDARAYAIADNRAGELAEWDYAQLAQTLGDPELAELSDAMGFTAEEIDELMNMTVAAASETENESADSGRFDQTQTISKPLREVDPPEIPDEPVAQRGDVWVCGKHEVLCGDTFEAETSEWIGRATCDLVVTDPPYAIFGSSTGVSSEVADDKMVRPFFAHLGRVVERALKQFCHAYVFTDWRSWAALWEGLRPTHVKVCNMLVWSKPGGRGSNYAMTHELIAFAHMRPKQTALGKTPVGVKPVLKPNVIQAARPSGEDRMHNAAKPIEVLVQLMENSSNEGDVVLDCFGGSGTTLIAAEQVGRIARVIEVEPRMVDVIVGRWEKLTGEKAERRSMPGSVV